MVEVNMRSDITDADGTAAGYAGCDRVPLCAVPDGGGARNYGRSNIVPHADAERHHHHSHASGSRHPGAHHLLTVENLSVSFERYGARCSRVSGEVLHGLTLSVHEGEIVAVVGASGSGKTVLADALLGLYEPNATVRGTIWFDGARQDAASLAALRGHGLSFVPQSVSHLDPLMRVGKQVQGAPRGRTRAERARDRARREARQRELFEAYGLSPEVARMYPHELSGGMARRVLLLSALMEGPRVLIADEPTPGLDLELAVRAVDDLRRFANTGSGVILITHDLELAIRVADRVAVFKDGCIVEETGASNFEDPALLVHPFSRDLCRALLALQEARIHGDEDLKSVGFESSRQTGEIGRACSHGVPAATVKARRREGVSENPIGDLPVDASEAPSTCQSGALKGDICAAAASHAPLLEGQGLSCSFGSERVLFRDLDFSVYPRERLAILAPSGAGKTTLCRILAGYAKPDTGFVLVQGVPLDRAARGLRSVQLISQHPEKAFDPRMRMRDSLAEAGCLDDARAVDLRVRFGVRDDWLERLPHELSGGELMRFCMVRALMTNPTVLICDESTAMLDLVTQDELWGQICDLQEARSFGLILVSHNPGVVAQIATRAFCL